MHPRIYLDNAATSFPKPPEVLRTMTDYAERLGASAGRGAYREAVESGQLVSQTRQRIARLLNVADARQIVFTLNCSEALNLALRGWLNAGDHVVTTRFEHNSVLRPLHAMIEHNGITADFVPVDPTTGRVDPNSMERAIRPSTRMIVLQHASNVTGVLQPVAEVAAIAKGRGIPLLIDGAQTIGEIELDVQTLGIDFLAFPGHKGLLGPLGTGGLYIRPGLERDLRSLVTGGTGSDSESPRQPDALPDKYEAGSHNAIGLIGLNAAVEWILNRGVSDLRAHALRLSRRFLERVRELDGITVFGPPTAEERVAVFSIRAAGLEPAELSAVLDAEFGIQTRSGLFCAPWAHETLGTVAEGGATRLSFGPFNTEADVDACIDALTAVETPVSRR